MGKSEDPLAQYVDGRVPPPRPTQGALVGSGSIPRATAFVGMVRDLSPDATGAFLDRLDRNALYALAVTLAAMVPDDQTPQDLLAWILDDQPRTATA